MIPADLADEQDTDSSDEQESEMEQDSDRDRLSLGGGEGSMGEDFGALHAEDESGDIDETSSDVWMQEMSIPEELWDNQVAPDGL